MSTRLPPNIVLAVRELCRPYLPKLTEQEILSRLTAPPASSPPATSAPEKLLTVPQTANVLGVCRATIGNLFHDGKLRRVKIRGATRIRQSDIDSLVAGGKPSVSDDGARSPRSTSDTAGAFYSGVSRVPAALPLPGGTGNVVRTRAAYAGLELLITLTALETGHVRIDLECPPPPAG